MNFNEIKPLPVTCRQSTIKCALACERCWFYKCRMGVQLRGIEYKEAATLGKIYHKLQQHGPGEEAKTKNWVAKQQRTLMDRVAKGEDIDDSMLRLANNLTSLYKKAEAMVHIFWEKFPQPPQFKVIGTEINHSMEWNGLTLEGTIDKLLFNENDGYFWIRDHKSTGLPLVAIFGGIAWSIQARIYRLLATDYVKGLKAPYEGKPMPIRGFILDGIIIPGIKLCKTDEKNAKRWSTIPGQNITVEDAYLRRVKKWYRDYEVKADLEGKKNTKAIDSRGILFTEPLMPYELRVALDRMKQLIETPFHPEYFHRDVTRTACFAYMKQCKYHDLCETDPNQWDSLFETKYKLTERVEEDENGSESL